MPYIDHRSQYHVISYVALFALFILFFSPCQCSWTGYLSESTCRKCRQTFFSLISLQTKLLTGTTDVFTEVYQSGMSSFFCTEKRDKMLMSQMSKSARIFHPIAFLSEN